MDFERDAKLFKENAGFPPIWRSCRVQCNALLLSHAAYGTQARCESCSCSTTVALTSSYNVEKGARYANEILPKGDIVHLHAPGVCCAQTK